MIPSKHANALYFTPRTPWGTRVPRNALRSHMHASEDAQMQPGQKRPNLLKRMTNALSHVHPYAGAEIEKTPGEKPSFGFGLGLRVGKGEPSTGEDPHGENSDWQNQRLHINEAATNKDRENEPTKPVQKSVAQLEAERTEAKIAEWKRRQKVAH